MQDLHCPVCSKACSLLDVVDFNKSCEEIRGNFLPLSGIAIYYALCSQCGFCFAPELMNWEAEKFKEHIYNDSYVLVDPDYVEARPRANAATLISLFGERAQGFRHLDYGGGDGQMSKILKEANWQSNSYDPLMARENDIGPFGKYGLITAFEVFEHVPNVQELMADLKTLLDQDGLLLFSTLLSDGNIQVRQRLSWWYASPRNGHLSLYSRKSLAILAHHHGFKFGSFSAGFHFFYTQVPHWAGHIIRLG